VYPLFAAYIKRDERDSTAVQRHTIIYWPKLPSTAETSGAREEAKTEK